jgi:O-acetyl-ADP-ribose deacetylase (regulator of RNase III)
MSRGVSARIIKDGMRGILKEAKVAVANKDIDVGECFVTGSGRLKRRGVDKIYHAVIKRLQSDFTSLYIIQKTLRKTLQEVIRDGMESVTVCGLGIEEGELGPRSVARITYETCREFEDKIIIKIIDDNIEFITEALKLSNVKNGSIKETNTDTKQELDSD